MEDKGRYGLVIEEGDVYAVESGEQNKRALPPKGHEKHRWIALICHSLSEEQAESTTVPGSEMLLDGSNLLWLHIGCIDCEEPYHLAKDTRCLVEPYEP